MSYFSIKFKIIIAVIIFLLCPFLVFAQSGGQVCSSSGYTVATINGVLNSEDEAIFNRDRLELLLPIAYHGEKLTIEYLLNPTHMGGISDIFGAISQKAFENETVVDYDLIEMLKDASQKVKTQKLLLVAHSQGNFYANSFYDVVTTQEGGIPAQSIGVYSVATPSGRVVDSGTRWLTSETDKVIAWVVGNVPFRKIMPPNVRIELQDGDNIGGHGFSEAYLKYSSKRVVDDVQYSLNRLSENTVQNEGAPCISPLKSTVSHKVQGAMLAVADPAGAAAVWILGAGVKVTALAYNTTEAFAKWGSHMEAVAIVWTYHTTVAVAKTAWGIASTIGSFAYDVLTGALSNNQSANNNSASVILATIPMQDLPITNVTDNNAIAIGATASIENQFGATDTKQQPQTVFVFEPKVQAGTNMPKLVFVGSFPGGLAGAQVMGAQSTAPVIEEVVILEEEIADNAAVAMATPALSTPQCSQTLATDGCLIATTAVHFEWTNVAGADHYLINKNGEYATTTEESFNVEIKDFSDYIFEVVAVGADGTASATSTQAVSVATIPIAINEIAWMGTKANTSDEWFEIKNNTGHTIDLTQWELNAKDGTPHVKLTGTISPHAYLIFERTDDTAVKGVDMHQKFTGELENNGDQLTLSYASTTMDQTPDGAWSAGATSTRQTMERYSSREPGADPENWGTNLGYIKNGTDAKDNPIEGTPGEQNSVSTLINKGEDITSDFTLTADEERYVVTDGVFVDASSTLTIEPGVTISFLNDHKENYGYFGVYGEIVAKGTEEDPVIFNSFSENIAGGIWIDNSNGTSTFEYSHFSDINNPIVIYRGNLEIVNSQFVNSNGGAESYGANTTVLIENTNFASSTSDTIGSYGSAVRVASSTITNQIDGDAIGLYNNSSLVMTSTTIDGVMDGCGIYSYGSTSNISSSTIRNTEGTAIALAYSTTTISNTIVQGGELNDYTIGIDVYRGTATITNTTVSGFTEAPGVWVTEPVSPITISGGEITGNATGIDVYSNDSAIITDVSIHDNGTSEADNVFIWPPTVGTTEGNPM